MLRGTIDDRDAPPEATLLTLRLINDAQERGATWADVARTLGLVSGKDAKNQAKRAARRLERALRRGEGEGA